MPQQLAAKKTSVEQLEITTRDIAHEMGQKQREISVSEFFTKNRHLLGFDNPKKALLTCVKEGVDNSLDACEEARILPEITVKVDPTENEDRFRVTIEDNGPGIVRDQIPRIFAKLLYGSKFHRLKMARGQQGIGISAAGMYGQLTTGRPVSITSRTKPSKPAYYCELMMDTQKNEPVIVKEQELEWDRPHGIKVVIELEAKYQKGRQSVDEYLEQTAVANPHAAFKYINPEKEELVLPGASSELPSEPKEIKPHPYGIEVGMLIHMLHDTRARTLSSFLNTEFSRVSSRLAKEICEKAGLPENARPQRVARQEADKLLKAIHSTKIMNPPTDCIVPIGEGLILKGLERQFKADFYTATTRTPSVYRGNPFLVEAGLAYGGELPQEGLARLFRFANRVPLLYQQSACIITESVIDNSWRNYGLPQSNGALPGGPLVLMVHVASVWVPFTSESKEAIAHYPEIEKEIRLALQECGRKLSTFLSRRRRHEESEKKKSYIKTYIPHIGIALREILGLKEKEEQRIVENLTEVLEKSRGG
ncbi:MAG TPA: DNA topoisomerase VI subunit B [Candidatus Tripitaka californicus]|uniref:DNA topoisomerase VI subunit B n=1 Tax=Candidatus Tripitaka californicus TaxID=3367616 RepID=UPI0040296164|nr:DNA topoisomerase VI subunit B [Planctomycetota bacterium]